MNTIGYLLIVIALIFSLRIKVLQEISACLTKNNISKDYYLIAT